MEINTKGATRRVKSMVRGSTCGRTEVGTKETLSMICLRATESTYGQISDPTRANGKLIKCMELVFSPGRMGDAIREKLLCYTKF